MRPFGSNALELEYGFDPEGRLPVSSSAGRWLALRAERLAEKVRAGTRGHDPTIRA